MSTKANSQKSFDAVKIMRSIRDKVDRELEGMTSQEVLAYYRERRRAFRERRKTLGHPEAS